MTGTTFCDSPSMRMLSAVGNRASASGSALRIVIRPDGAVARSMAILGMDRILPVYATIDAAMPASPN